MALLQSSAKKCQMQCVQPGQGAVSAGLSAPQSTTQKHHVICQVLLEKLQGICNASASSNTCGVEQPRECSCAAHADQVAIILYLCLQQLALRQRCVAEHRVTGLTPQCLCSTGQAQACRRQMPCLHESWVVT